MNWQLLIPLLITAILTILGWYAAHRLAAWRDRANKRREQRITFLVDAFRRLAAAAHHPNIFEIANEIESAVTDIQLFGSVEQVKKVQFFVQAFAELKKADIDELLASLRDDLRKELDLPALHGKIYFLKILKKGSEADSSLRSE